MALSRIRHAAKSRRSRWVNRYLLVFIGVVFYLCSNLASLPGLTNPNAALVYPRSAGLCAIQKGALRYIDEWVEYNLAIGFDKVYIFDNSDDFELKEWYNNNTVIPNLQDRVELQHYPGPNSQSKAYSVCIRRIQSERKHSWIAFIDLDEFLVMRDMKKYPYVMDLLDDLPDHIGGLAVNWVLFGMNNQTHYEPKPVTLRFQYRLENATNRHIKTIAKTEHVRSARCHDVKYKLFSGVKTEDTSGNVIKGRFNYRLTNDVVTLYHFNAKSLEEYKERCKRGRGAAPRKVWKDAPACQSESYILSVINEEGQTVFDPAAWKILKERVPRYAEYEI